MMSREEQVDATRKRGVGRSSTAQLGAVMSSEEERSRWEQYSTAKSSEEGKTV